MRKDAINASKGVQVMPNLSHLVQTRISKTVFKVMKQEADKQQMSLAQWLRSLIIKELAGKLPQIKIRGE
jgi:hypothetical protein